MNKYVFNITEVAIKRVKVEAENPEAAEEIVRNQYLNNEIVFTKDDVEDYFVAIEEQPKDLYILALEWRDGGWDYILREDTFENMEDVELYIKTSEEVLQWFPFELIPDGVFNIIDGGNVELADFEVVQENAPEFAKKYSMLWRKEQ